MVAGRRTTQSFADFLPDLTSRRAHLMRFQLPQTIPQPQRSQACGITVGRRGAAASGEAQEPGSAEAQARGGETPRSALARAPRPMAPSPSRSRAGRSVTVPALPAGERGRGRRGRRGAGAPPDYLSRARCPPFSFLRSISFKKSQKGPTFSYGFSLSPPLPGCPLCVL